MPIGGIPFVGKKLLKLGYDIETVKLILDAWRPSTKKLYAMYLKKWALYCVEFKVKLLNPTLPQACKFLRRLADKGSGYGAINAARCALSTILPYIDGQSFGKHPIVCNLVKGTYERNPPKPKYSKFWDVNKVFKQLMAWGKNSKLTLKMLSFKLVVLLLLVTSQRGQTILALSVDSMDMDEEERAITFKLKTLLKHNRLGDPRDSIVLRRFDQSPRLCVVRTIKEYLKRTEKVRKDNSQLLLSFVAPHKPISRDTFARWTVKVLGLSGIDTTQFKGHSTRGASTSAAKRAGVPINLIMKQAGWRNEESFARFYDKDIDKDNTQVGLTLLQGVGN